MLAGTLLHPNPLDAPSFNHCCVMSPRFQGFDGPLIPVSVAGVGTPGCGMSPRFGARGNRSNPGLQHSTLPDRFLVVRLSSGVRQSDGQADNSPPLARPS